MHFLDTSEIKEYEYELVNDLALALSDARSREEWRKEYMSIEMLKNECRAEGREEGRAEGREEGRAEGRTVAMRENAIKMLKDGVLESLAAKYSGLSIDEVRALAATL